LSNAASPSRADIEDFLYKEADLLDSWQLDEWLALLDEDATYYVPPNDKPDADHRSTLFIVADDIARLRERVKRLKDPNCHAEYPHSRTRRMIGNVRITGTDGDIVSVAANFVIYRFRRDERIREYVGRYRYRLRRRGDELKIVERRAILDSEELGTLGSVSFIL
jgi:p-cumate 2,3-dioxygenase beta subunit